MKDRVDRYDFEAHQRRVQMPMDGTTDTSDTLFHTKELGAQEDDYPSPMVKTQTRMD